MLHELYPADSPPFGTAIVVIRLELRHDLVLQCCVHFQHVVRKVVY